MTPQPGYDVAVIGGGIAGVSAAYELGAFSSVVLLEKEDALAVHSTGRSAALYLPSYGPPEVRALTGQSRAIFDELAEGSGATVLTPTSLLWLASDDASRAGVAELVAQQPQLEPIDRAAALAYAPELRAEAVLGAAVDHGAMDIDVAALHEGYVSGAKARGVEIRRGAALSGATRTAQGWELHCGAQTVACTVVVDAAGAWADEVASICGVAGVRLQARRRSLFLSRPSERLAGLPVHTVSDPLDRFYFRPEGPALLASPADATPVDPHDAKPDETEIARAIEELNRVTSLDIRSVAASWAGLRTFTPDGLPVVGHWPDDPSFVFLAGQGGYGIQMAPALARCVGALVGSGDRPEAYTAAGVAARACRPR